jgi:hypothetical protein
VALAAIGRIAIYGSKDERIFPICQVLIAIDWSDNEALHKRARRKLLSAGVDYHMLFGGTKESSYGSREQGRYAMEFYTTVKTAYMFGG